MVAAPRDRALFDFWSGSKPQRRNSRKIGDPAGDVEVRRLLCGMPIAPLLDVTCITTARTADTILHDAKAERKTKRRPGRRIGRVLEDTATAARSRAPKRSTLRPLRAGGPTGSSVRPARRHHREHGGCATTGHGPRILPRVTRLVPRINVGQAEVRATACAARTAPQSFAAPLLRRLARRDERATPTERCVISPHHDSEVRDPAVVARHANNSTNTGLRPDHRWRSPVRAPQHACAHE